MLNVLKNSKTLVLLTLAGVLVLASSPGLASATLAGQNGPIVYVEETEVDCGLEADTAESEAVPSCQEEDVTQVITTNATGGNPVVAAEFSDSADQPEEATTATISPNDAQGNHTIVLATEKLTCEDLEYEFEMDSLSVEGAVNEDYCYFYAAEAVIYKVQIDKNGNPLSDPIYVTSVAGPEDALVYTNYYVELSYSPDQKSVVGLRFYYSVPYEDDRRVASDDDSEDIYGEKHVIERINIATGEVEQLVGPKFDPFMNVGYAQSGAIYFTQIICGDNCPWDKYYDRSMSDYNEDWTAPTSEVWYFAPNSTEATQLTNTSEINEYFLSASPDSKTLLVCDPTTGLYYTVSTATGEVTTLNIEDENDPFLPLFFSPNGTSYLGVVGVGYRHLCVGRFEAAKALVSELTEVEKDCGVAIAPLDKFKDAVLINRYENPDDWAPIVNHTTTTTQVLGTTTKTVATPKLQSTGSEAVLFAVLAGSFITILAGVSFAYRRAE